MIRLLLVVLLLVFAAFAALAVWAYNTWGVWGFLGVLFGLVAFFWLMFKMVGVAIKRVFFMPFKMKGAVLKNAVLTVHSVTPAGPPMIDADYDAEDEDEEDQRMLEDRTLRGTANGDDDQDDDEDDDFDEDDEDLEPSEPQDWYHLDVTITPKAAKGPFILWEPGELVLVGPDAKGDDLGGDNLGRVQDVQVWQDGQWQDDEGSKYPGPQRLRLHAGVTRGARRARLKYYFEILEGELELPHLT